MAKGAMQAADPLSPEQVAAFQEKIRALGAELYRDLPWRNTRDPYQILVSEVMLQQTQVARVLTRWPAWIDEFPTLEALAAVPLARVLEAWQGMGYNRRALALKRLAQACVDEHGGQMPRGYKELVALPGVGPATAAGVRAFAFGEPGVYLETNVRAVMLHEFFPGEENVSDKRVAAVVAQTCDASDPRAWYYALLDYGAHLKKTLPNPSRRSAHHTRQSKFEGSHRQKRAWILRYLIDANTTGVDATQAAIASELCAAERAAGRGEPPASEVAQILEEMAAEGLISCSGDVWGVASD